MLLEIPSQIGLAGKVQVVRYLLHGHFRGTQQHLCLQYDMPVYNGLRRLARHLPGAVSYTHLTLPTILRV